MRTPRGQRLRSKLPRGFSRFGHPGESRFGLQERSRNSKGRSRKSIPILTCQAAPAGLLFSSRRRGSPRRHRSSKTGTAKVGLRVEDRYPARKRNGESQSEFDTPGARSKRETGRYGQVTGRTGIPRDRRTALRPCRSSDLRGESSDPPGESSDSPTDEPSGLSNP